ncbi:MAG: bifunctional nuclease family protein [candidate division Zixibacteria bacterium]|nr:bifunctional nuclease family protein [candidate division Zixibacteria bacterium]
MVEIQIDGLAMDLVSNSPVVVLASKELNKVLPIWIGHNEAWAIAMEISGLGSKRPLTHDLFKNAILAMGGTVEKVEITGLKEQTFFARLHILIDDKHIELDARPSDSIAMALKAKCPIFVNEDLFITHEEDPDTPVEKQMPQSGPPESLADRLKKIDPEDFGKYSL